MDRDTACCSFILFITTFHVLLIFVQAAEECRYTLTSESGNVMSPNFPQDYPNDTECTWNIEAPEGHYVSLTFDILEVESYKGKCIDVVEVKDGATSFGELLGSYCEINRPLQVLTSSFNHLRIWFYTDHSETRRGFNASYTTHKETGCGGHTNNQSGTITSPRFGKHLYPSGISCEWVITRPAGEYVRLTFSHFGMEFKCWNANCNCLDKLEIWDGPANNATHVGSICRLFQPPVYVSRSNRVRLLFTSNEEGRFLGFRVQLTTSVTPGCGGDFSSVIGQFLSPNYPSSFPALSHCIWRVSAPGDHYISLRFTEFVGLNGTNPSCPLDYVQVLDGLTNKSPQLGRYCQENIPSVLISTSPHLYIQFRSQLINSVGRFKAVFMLHSRECTASLGVSDGRISDAQLTASSFLRQRIGINNWRLFLPRFGRINNPTNSFVPSWCSQTQNYNTGKTIGEYFQIDLRNLTNITGVATQGFYLYPSSHFVTTYKVEYSFNGTNWISYIGENPNDTSKGYTEFVGNLNVVGIVQNAFKPTIIANMIRIIPTSYISPSRHICLKSEIFGCPFAQECGGLFSTMELDEISVRTAVKHGKKCTWFSVPGPSTIPGLVLVLRFTYFDLPCDVGRVIIEERRSGKTKAFCGSTIPPSFLTKISEPLAVTIDAEPGSETVGFNIKSESKSLGCGEIIHVDGTESAITSPNYPEPYAADQECNWIMLTTPGYQITLNFETFDLEPKMDSECKDYVEVRDGQFESAPVIDRFCGSDKPPPIVSTENYLYVSFKSNDKEEGNGFRALHKNVFRRSAERQGDASQVQDPEEESRSTAGSLKINVAYHTLTLISLKLVFFT